VAKRKAVDAPLGLHNGLPILSKKIKIVRTGDGLSQAMTITPVDVKDGSKHYISMRVKQTRTYHDNVFSKDNPDELVGFEEVIQFAAQAAVFDDRPDAAEQVTAMEERLEAKAAKEAAEAERKKREAKGEFQLIKGDGDEPDGEGSEDDF
jgi:hypothetical protein